MDQDINDFLRMSVTPEVQAVLHKAVVVFDAFEIEDYEDSILDLILGSAEQEEQATASLVVSEFRAKLEYILGLHSVVVLDTASLEMLVDLCAGLKAIDDYLDMDSVIDVCDGEETSGERFAEVMAMVTAHSAEEVMACLESVQDGLVEKIRALARQTPDAAQTHPADRAIAALERYRAQIEPTDLSYQTMLDAGLPLGLPYKTYLDYYSNTHKSIDLADPAHLTQFVHDVVGLTLISADAYANPIMQVQQTLTAFTSDVNLSMRADILAKSILQRFTSEKN